MSAEVLVDVLTDLVGAADVYQEHKDWLASADDAELEHLDESLYEVAERYDAAAAKALAIRQALLVQLERYDALDERREELNDLYEQCEERPGLYDRADSERADVNEILADIADDVIRLLRTS